MLLALAGRWCSLWFLRLFEQLLVALDRRPVFRCTTNRPTDSQMRQKRSEESGRKILQLKLPISSFFSFILSLRKSFIVSFFERLYFRCAHRKKEKSFLSHLSSKGEWKHSRLRLLLLFDLFRLRGEKRTFLSFLGRSKKTRSKSGALKNVGRCACFAPQIAFARQGKLHCETLLPLLIGHGVKKKFFKNSSFDVEPFVTKVFSHTLLFFFLPLLAGFINRVSLKSGP